MKENQNKENKKIGLPFDAPYAYFENLDAKVLAKIKAEKKPRSISSWFMLSPKRTIALASVLLVLLVATFTILPRTQEDSLEELLADVNTEDISNYLLSDLPEQELLAYSSEQELNLQEDLWNLDNLNEDLLEDILLEETELEFELKQ